MTTMDSDSESQDSDDGRRFRFEATRKDASSHLESRNKTRSAVEELRSHRKEEKDRSKYSSSRKEYRSSKDRDTSNKELRSSTKYSKYEYSKHESRSFRHDNSKERDTRDSSINSRSSGTTGLTKYRTRESKEHRNRDRSEHRKHRSEERSRDRSHDDRSLTDKHRNKSHDKYKHHIRDRSRDRSYQSEKSKPSDSSRIRGEHERHDSYKKAYTKENESKRSRAYSRSKSSEKDERNGDTQNTISQEVSKKDVSVGSQECKDLDLSEFDILSETDENLSDVSDVKSPNSHARHHKEKVHKRHSSEKNRTPTKKNARKSKHLTEERDKVNARESDPLNGSSNNNPSAISDFLRGAASSLAASAQENCENDDDKKCRPTLKEEIVSSNSKWDDTNSRGETCLQLDSNDSSGENTMDSAYGPALPPQFSIDSSNTTNSSPEETKSFIGPSLPPNLENMKSSTEASDGQILTDAAGLDEDTGDQNLVEENSIEEEEEEDEDMLFGPALPPHLLAHKATSETRSQIIGPVLPSTIELDNDVECSKASHTESEDEDGIGPLPVDHPALKNNYVHELLEHRARAMKDERKEEAGTITNEREEWMTELPPAQASNLGLGPRKFRMRAGPDMSDRSSWTDTPAKKAERQRQREEERLHEIINPNPKISKQTETTDTEKTRKREKREKSLLEVHQNKLRKKKKKEEKDAKLTGLPTRRPFDRDIDLKANQFDQAQKKTIFMKAQLLDERFSRGQI